MTFNPIYKISLYLLLFLGILACNKTKEKNENNQNDNIQSEIIQTKKTLLNTKPFARYWWFASEMKKDDIRFNLDWLKSNGFGGVELAWVYPHNRRNTNMTDKYTARQEWLSPEWQEIVRYTIDYADSIGLACDLTMGTLWPFGDSYVPYEHASQQFGEDERQEIVYSWEHPKKGYVIDHINPKHYLPYLVRTIDYFPHPKTKQKQAYFIDSWEVHTDKLWTDGFDKDFQQKYSYDIKPFMNNLYEEQNKAQLYDYRSLISEKVIAFYKDFDSVLNANNINSRGQCSGAPADIISAYAQLDIPEGESMLYEPEFNSIPSSSALLNSKKTVSAETFTCLYGWPGNYMREEQTGDLKLVADALFANGINKIIWHGKPHNPKDSDTISFYATVHLGSDGSLAQEIPSFNDYLNKVSAYMNKGNSYSDVAVYLPTEDAWIKGVMPKDKQFIWAKEFYEMRYIYFPEELRGHHPVWINYEFLSKAKWENGCLKVGDATFNSLYVDARYLDVKVLKIINKLAQEGLPVTLKQTPSLAGTLNGEDWMTTLKELDQNENVSNSFKSNLPPLVNSKNIPPFWARETKESLYLFFANPNSRSLKFPITYGQSFSDENIVMPLDINYKGKKYKLELSFEANQSLMYEIKNGEINQIDISLKVKSPKIKSLPEDFVAPWLVK